MKIYRNLDFELNTETVATIGIFDGVHLAHKLLLEKTIGHAKNTGKKSLLITFFPHPRMVLEPIDQNLKLLATLNEKIKLIDAFDVDHLVIIPFNVQTSQITAKEFVEEILAKKMKVSHLILGYDHHFGKARQGNFNWLSENKETIPFSFEEISRQTFNKTTISSSNIRQLILAKDFQETKRFLGRPYSFSGTVVKGNQLGRTIGYPTANIFVEESYKMLPPNGVYAVNIQVFGETLKGMLNIGIRPTLNGLTQTTEVNIFDFNQEIYGQNIMVSVEYAMRDEVKFSSLDALKDQLKKDKDLAISLMA